MSLLSKTAWLAKYNDASTGLYKTGQIEGIGSDDHRAMIQDLYDSAIFYDDLLKVFDGAFAEYDEPENKYVFAFNSGLPDIIDYRQHRIFAVQFDVTNTDTGTTMQFDGLGEYPIYKLDSTGTYVDVEAGDLKQNGWYFIAFTHELESLEENAFLLIGGIGGGDPEESVRKQTITSAEILTGNSSPIGLQGSPGAGKYYMPYMLTLSMDFNTTPYDTNTELALEYEDGTQMIIDSDFLASTDDNVRSWMISSLGGVLNQGFRIRVLNDNPLNGDSDIKVIVKYRTVTI